ncbi:MAG: hypothetical protein LBP86_05450 [Azoarcus sp.]|jgi:hypothetical protein|nr:hypothetical protein [Azoarcus sp.]
MAADYIPRPDAQFLEWARNFYAYALAHYGTWQVPSPQPGIETPLAAFAAAYGKCQNPNRGKIDVLEKNETRKTLVKACRTYYSGYINCNPQVPDADRDALNVPIHNTTRRPSVPPATIPVVDRIDTGILRQLTLHFRDNGSHHKAKPEGVHGCEFLWVLRDTPPGHVEDLVHSAFETHTPLTLVFDESQRGKTLYLCPRWEGNTGLKGPYGEIYKVVVP